MNEDFNNNNESSTYRYVPEASREESAQPYSSYTVPDPELKPKRKKSGAGKLVALALVCSLLGGALGAGGALLAMNKKLTAAEAEKTTQVLLGQRETAMVETAVIGTGAEMTPAQVYAANVNSTVGITTEVTTNFWGYQTTSPASGSGFILTADGYILTNYHVVEDASSITVTTYDDTSYEATLIGYDKTNDVAVLKVQAEALIPVVLGSSDKLNVGDTVLAIGNPLGELTFTLTQGLVSALNRNISTSSGTRQDLIQTDCAINAGNSGGALFNLYGEVIGITNAKYSSASSTTSIDNIGFAIPIDSVRSIVESIIEKGYIVKPFIGVSVSDVGAELRSYGLPEGAVVKLVREGSPAEAAGLQLNDIITEVNGSPISGSSDLTSYVSSCAPGDTLDLKVYRQGNEDLIVITVTVAEQQQSALEEEPEAAGQQPQQRNPNSGNGGYSFGYGFPWSMFGF